MEDRSLRLQETLEAVRRRFEVPGIALALRLGGEPFWQGAAGSATRETENPLDPAARFLIYSITKTLTAIAILRLHEDGVLGLDDPAGPLLPEIPLPGEIHVRHLLQHTSGLRDYGGLAAYHEAVRTRPSAPWSQAEFLAATLPPGLLFPPGEGWSYSNVGSMLLRLILERLSGTSFRRAIETRIARPLALGQPEVVETPADLAGLTPGYGAEIGSPEELADIRGSYHPGWCAPGVAASTAPETVLVYDRLFAGDLLGPETLRSMLELVPVPGRHPPAVTPSSGLGILGDPDGQFGACFGHGGGGPGYSLSVSVFPRFGRRGERLSMAMFCNPSRGATASAVEHEMVGFLCDLV